MTREKIVRKPLPAYWCFGCVWFWVCFDVGVVVHRQHTSPHHRRSPSWAGPLKVPSSFSVKRQSMPQIYDESGGQKGQISTPVWDKDFLKRQLFLGRISKAHACWIVLSIVSLFWWFNIWQCGPKCSKGPCWALQENEFHQRRLDFDNWCNRELENQDGSHFTESNQNSNQMLWVPLHGVVLYINSSSSLCNIDSRLPAWTFTTILERPLKITHQ